MIELTALFALIAVGLALCAVFVVTWWVFKLAFKIVLFPIALLFGALKVGLVMLLGLILLVVAPVLLAVFAVLVIPLIALAAVAGVGFFLFALAT
jgi:hypothetical protein